MKHKRTVATQIRRLCIPHTHRLTYAHTRSGCTKRSLWKARGKQLWCSSTVCGHTSTLLTRFVRRFTCEYMYDCTHTHLYSYGHSKPHAYSAGANKFTQTHTHTHTHTQSMYFLCGYVRARWLHTTASAGYIFFLLVLSCVRGMVPQQRLGKHAQVHRLTRRIPNDAHIYS